MAIPFIIGGAALVAGLFGAKKGYDAKKNYDEAKSVVRSAQQDYEETVERTEEEKAKANHHLQELGKLRLRTESELLGRFVKTIKNINNVSYKPIEVGGSHIAFSAPDIDSIALSSYEAADLLKDGIGAISAGALAGVGATGLASGIGVASTGTAIGALSGAAATNATLAWLGGGSLAAGGMGIAGGTAVLGGAIAGPVIAAMGYSAAKRSEKALTEAYERESEIRVAISQLVSGISILKSISARTQEIINVTLGLSARLAVQLDQADILVSNKKETLKNLEYEKSQKEAAYRKRFFLIRLWHLITRTKPDFSFQDPLSFNNFTAQEKSSYMATVSSGYALHTVLKVKVIDESGLITEDSEAIIDANQDLIEGN